MKDFRKLAKNRLFLNLFFIRNMPMGLLNGLRIIEVNEKHASVSVPYNYLTKNPFRSLYFAVQSMAAELSSAVMAIAEIRSAPRPVSMLVLDLKATFIKKARSKIVFTCSNGAEIVDAIKKTLETDEGQTVTILSKGVDKDGDVVSEFHITWTFKAK